MLVNPARDVVLAVDSGSPGGSSGGAPGGASTTAGRWSFHLRATPSGHTRLIERLGMRAGPTLPEKILTSRTLAEPVSDVMSREMLNNISKLAPGRGDR